MNMISCSSRGVVLALISALGFCFDANAQTPTAVDSVHTDAKGRHLAPRDTFYTLEYVSAATDKGVEGFPPGTEVHLVSVNKEARTLTVTDGHANVQVPPEKLTNDLDIAGYVQAKDQAKQAQVIAYQQAEAKAYQEYEKQVADYTAKDLEKREQETKDAQARALAQANAGRDEQPVTSSSSNNGYYNEGGYGYGSPYGYFTNLNLGATTGTKANGATTSSSAAAGKGTLPSSQAGGGRKP